jgi:hypothetical protein
MDNPAAGPSTAVLLVVLVLCSQVATVAAVPASSASSKSAVQADPSLPDELTVPRGGVAEIRIATVTSASPVINIRGPLGKYEASVTVADGGDGVVRLLIDTRLAGRTADERQVYSTVNDSDVLVTARRESELAADPLPAGKYTLRLRAGTTVDSSTLRLTPEQPPTMTVGTIPGSIATDAPVGLVNQTFSPGDTIARGDRLVVRARGTELYRQVTAEDPPGMNVGWANDSHHRIRTDPGVAPFSMEGIRITYSSESPQRLTESRPSLVGIDTDGDGLVEADLTKEVTEASVLSDSVYIQFARTVNVPANSTVVAAYSVPPPTFDSDNRPSGVYTLRTEDISVTTFEELSLQPSPNSTTVSANNTTANASTGPQVLNAVANTDTGGQIVYPPVGAGMFGYDTSIRLLVNRNGSERNAQILPENLIRRATADGSVYLLYPTLPLQTASSNASANYRVSLERGSKSPYVSNETEQTRVLSPITVENATNNVTVRRVDDRNTSITISGKTNVAPHSVISVRVLRQDPPGLISRKVKTDSNGRWQIQVDELLSAQSTRLRVDVTSCLVDGTRTIGFDDSDTVRWTVPPRESVCSAEHRQSQAYVMTTSPE